MKVKMDYKDNTAVGVFEVYDICADGYISNKEVCIDNPPSLGEDLYDDWNAEKDCLQLK